jgi:hypothetical protein
MSKGMVGTDSTVHSREAVVIGHFTEEETSSMRGAVARAGGGCVFVGEVSRALILLDSMALSPCCVFASLDVDLPAVLEHLRGSGDLDSVPLVALLPYPGSESYMQANRLGADDSIPRYDMSGMTRLVANLLQGDSPDEDSDEVIVIDAPGEGPSSRPDTTNQRLSRRIQHAGVATFCTLRSFERTYALTDNVSRQGIYLRTLAPPAIGCAVRIEMRDKHGEVFQVCGTVTRRYAPCRVGGTRCHGFGVDLDTENTPKWDLEKFNAMYGSLLDELARPGSRSAPLPSVVPRLSIGL